jgi:hypothetical protein
MLDTASPFTRADARGAGITVKQLLSGRYKKLLYDVYVDAAVIVTSEVRARAALHVAPAGAYASHRTAAELWGLPVPLDGNTHISVNDRPERLRRVGVKSHFGQPGAACTRRRGIPISTPEQTFIDLAASGLSLVDLVIIGDAMVRAELASPTSLRQALDAWEGNGTRLAYRALALVREGVDSAMETRTRLLLVFAGLPEPQVNFILRAEDGSWRMRFDLSYPEAGVIVEYDGRHHTEIRSQWERDIYRREDLDRMGYRLIVITSRGIFQEPLRTLERIRDVLRDRGVKVPRQFKNDWRRHFAEG